MAWLYVPNLEDSPCSAESKESKSDSKPSWDPGIEPCAVSSGTLSPRRASWIGWKKRPWIRVLCGTMSDPSMADAGVEKWISSLADSPVRTSPERGGERESRKETEAASGSNLGGSFARYDRDTSSWKTSQLSFLEGLDEYSETWPKWGSMRNGAVYRREPWVPPTSESGSSSWHTPETSEGGWKNSNCKDVTPGVSNQAKEWHTPTTRDEAATDGPQVMARYGTKEMKTSDQRLRNQARAWPTPTAMDGEAGGGHADGHLGLTKVTKNWPTATGADGMNSGARKGKAHPGVSLTDKSLEWTTPMASDRANRGKRKRKNPRKKSEGGEANVADDVQHWATPTAQDGRRPGSDATSTQGGNLKRDAEAWATPASRDYRTPNAKSYKQRGGGKKGEQLQNQVEQIYTTATFSCDCGFTKTYPYEAWIEKEIHNPCPGCKIGRSGQVSYQSLRQGQQAGGGKIFSKGRRTSDLRLNPAFSLFLMGFPWWWTHPGPINCAAQEMRSYLHRLRSHLRFYLPDWEFGDENQ